MSEPVTFVTDVSFAIKGSKLTRYLLDPEHPVGKSKAKFFLGHGFKQEEPDHLALALLNHSANEPERVPTRYGMRLIIDGPMRTPAGTTPLVRSVWQIDDASGIARLITAHPI